MTSWQFLKALRGLTYVLVFVLGSLVFVGSEIYKEIAIELACYRQFGPEWKQRYESHYGSNSLSQAHEKMAFGVVGVLLILTVLWLIYRSIAGGNQRFGGSSRRRRR